MSPGPPSPVVCTVPPGIRHSGLFLENVPIETNLRSLLRMDAWSVGVLVAMIASQVH
jgi:hypothetical protein